jgi:hypothetical protein
MTALAPAAGAAVPAPVAPTIDLAAPTLNATTPTPLRVLGASTTTANPASSYVLFQTALCGDAGRQLLAQNVAGGAPAVGSNALNTNCGGDIAGSVFTNVGPTNSTLAYENATGAGAGTRTTLAGQPIVGSVDGEYTTTNTGTNGALQLRDYAALGGNTGAITLPNSNNTSDVVRADADTSGVLVEYTDAAASGCGTTLDDLVFVSTGGAVTTLVHPSAAGCPNAAIGEIALGGGNATWVSSSLTPKVINTEPATGGVSHPFALPLGSSVNYLAVTNANVGWVTVQDDVTLETAPVTGGAATATTYQVGEDGGLQSTGTQFAFTIDDDPVIAGVYVTTNASAVPTEIYANGYTAATAVAVSPGRVAYSDNEVSPAKPVYGTTLANNGATLTEGAEGTLAGSSAGYGISLSGIRALYPSGGAAVLATSGVQKTLAAAGTFDHSNGAAQLDRLSGRRAVYPVKGADAHDFQLYDDVTNTTTNEPAAGVAAYTVWGDYLVTLDTNGTINRQHIPTGVTTTLATIPGVGAGQVSGRVAAYGNSVAWTACINLAGVCTPSNGFVNDAPGAALANPVGFPASASSPISLSNNYLAYINGTAAAGIPVGALVAQPTVGGGAINVSSTPCQASPFTEAPSLDGNTIAWLECGGTAVSSGVPEAKPLPHVSNLPWFLGDPEAPTTVVNGSWHADFVTSAVLTACTVTISTVPVTTLPCDPTDMTFGEAVVNWNTAGVAPGAYTYTLNAANGDGPLLNTNGLVGGVTGSVTVPGVAGTLPIAPTNVMAGALNASASVSWVPPANLGTGTLLGYEVVASANGGPFNPVANDGTFFNTNTGPNGIATGLTNGVSYTFEVAAITTVGQGPFSLPGPAGGVTPTGPAAVPDAPTGVTALPGNAQTTVSWTAPASNGSPIQSYVIEYSTDNGNTFTTVTFPTAATADTVLNLINGTAYIFRVAAVNGVGEGPFSAWTAPVTPSGGAGAGITVPGAPTNVTGTPGDGQVTVSWTAPVSNGNSPITGYEVQFSCNGGQTWTGVLRTATNGVPTTTTITGLTNGVACIFRVAAINAAGIGPVSAVSLPVTPGTILTSLTPGASRTLVVGTHLPLTTTLTTNGKPVVGATVVLYGRPDVDGTYTQIRSLTTNASGVASTTVSPNVNVQYSWSFAGDANDASASTPVFSFGVYQAVTAHENKTTVTHGHSVEIYGIVTPNNGSGGIVHLQKFVDGDWVAITRATAQVFQQTLPDGSTGFGYVIHWTPVLGGQHLTLRVHRRTDSINLYGSSPSFGFHVV